MPGSLWRVADESTHLSNCPDDIKKLIIFGRIYTPGQGYRYSETNQQILNLKIAVPPPQSREVYKNNAISLFAQELVELFTSSDSRYSYILTPMPPSKMETHPNFDDRIERVGKIVAQRCPRVHYIKLLRAARNCEAAHLTDSGRSAAIYHDSMEIIPGATLGGLPHIIIILDDVLTSGAHFVAARQHLTSKFPSNQVIGIFWAKAERINPLALPAQAIQ